MMRIGRSRGRDFDDGHHAAIFMRENVTVDYIETRVVDEATAHLEVAGNLNRLALAVQQRVVALSVRRRRIS